MKRSIIALALVAGCAQMGGSGDDASWTPLIDRGTGLENFERVGDANWRTEGDAVVADQGKGGFLLSKSSYGDFQLRAEFWADHNTNSGIYMRCADRAKLTDKSCHEANIFDQRPDQTYATGGIVHVGRVLQPVKAGGRWNVFEITAQGRRLTVVLNGVKTAEIDNAEFLSGPIALQYGTLPPNAAPGGAIKFRKVQIRRI